MGFTVRTIIISLPLDLRCTIFKMFYGVRPSWRVSANVYHRREVSLAVGDIRAQLSSADGASPCSTAGSGPEADNVASTSRAVRLRMYALKVGSSQPELATGILSAYFSCLVYACRGSTGQIKDIRAARHAASALLPEPHLARIHWRWWWQ